MIFHAVPIRAAADDIYAAITDEKLIAKWWLPGAKIEPKVGAIGIFPLSDNSGDIRVRVETVEPSRIVWRCLSHKHKEWTNTVISFDIVREGDGNVLNFRHDGWADTGGVFGKVSFYWASLYLPRLKNMLEGRSKTSVCDSIRIARNRADIFAALSDSDALAKWWPKQAESDPRDGGRLVFHWFGGAKIETTYDIFEPPAKLGYRFGPEEVSFTLEEKDGETEVAVVHREISIADGTDHLVHIAQAWTFLLCNLKTALERDWDLRSARKVAA